MDRQNRGIVHRTKLCNRTIEKSPFGRNRQKYDRCIQEQTREK